MTLNHFSGTVPTILNTSMGPVLDQVNCPFISDLTHALVVRNMFSHQLSLCCSGLCLCSRHTSPGNNQQTYLKDSDYSLEAKPHVEFSIIACRVNNHCFRLHLGMRTQDTLPRTQPTVVSQTRDTWQPRQGTRSTPQTTVVLVNILQRVSTPTILTVGNTFRFIWLSLVYSAKV